MRPTRLPTKRTLWSLWVRISGPFVGFGVGWAVVLGVVGCPVAQLILHSGFVWYVPPGWPIFVGVSN
jgi:hypothetical protein